MTTDLPDGTVVQVRDRGTDWWRLLHTLALDHPHKPGARCYGGVGRPLVPGDVIVVCVWKGDRLEERRRWTVKDGDFDWVPVGRSFATTKLDETGLHALGPIVYANRRRR